MDWASYMIVAAVVFVGIFLHGFFSAHFEARKERTEAWQRLSDAFNGVTVRRVMSVAPSGSADQLVYDGVQFLGAFELTKDILRFYRFKIKDGSIIEIPIDRIRESKLIEDHHEPAATLIIEALDGSQLSIDASVPEKLCSQLVRLGNEVGSISP